ncbi:hypothetical protein LSTR_LSTR012450 [Laodelphax striatellus]|uniref:Uncharacterized protein n=1 Tax=Laodelphax striatellus TaxID=195883 RepID=A0A482XL61_LAOST|nr:hypothetical protein LSTR_LSTR012450 [Laodelphax striatellus]
MVYLHSAEDYPSFDLEPQLVWLGQIAKMFFSSKDTYTTDNARQLSVAQRKCIFEDERRLITAPKYTYVACMLQCRMHKTLHMCACVPHFYPKIGNRNQNSPHHIIIQSDSKRIPQI